RQDAVVVPDQLRHQRPAGHLYAQRPPICDGAGWRRRAVLEHRQGAAQERAAGRLGVDLRADAGIAARMTNDVVPAGEGTRLPRLVGAALTIAATIALAVGAAGEGFAPPQIEAGGENFAPDSSPPAAAARARARKASP